MPNYDVSCASCGYESVILLTFAEVDRFDSSAKCPECESGDKQYRRVMKSAPAGFGGAKSQAKAQSSRTADLKANFVSSGARDDMRHRESKTRDKDQVAQAVENVRKGAFEGF